MSETVPFQDPAGVGVNDERRMIAGIEQDGIRGLRADPVEREQLFAQPGGRYGEHAIERTAVAGVEILNESLQSTRFLTEVSGAADELFEFGERSTTNATKREHPRGSQLLKRALDVGPSGVLRQVGADDHLETRLRRPPMLRAPLSIQQVVELANTLMFSGPHTIQCTGARAGTCEGRIQRR